MHTLFLFRGSELTDQHYTQLNDSSRREFQVRLPAKLELSDRLYFLLVEAETENILASGYLKPVSPVICAQETFSFLNIGGIIANEKGQGYGKQVVTAIKEYLIAANTIGLGFCFPHNQDFYEKCGLKVDTMSTKRIIYKDGEEERTAEGQYIIYQDSSEGFMEKILSYGDQKIFVPDASIW